jgi:serine/threonine protein kinase
MGVICCGSQSKPVKLNKKFQTFKVDTKLGVEHPEIYSDSLYFKNRQKSHYQKLLLQEGFSLAPVCPTDYELIGCVGKGSYGSVLLAKTIPSGDLIAIKEIPFCISAGSSRVTEEVSILSELHHPNIVRYLGSKVSENSLQIFMEFVSGGTINSLLQKHGAFCESLIKIYTFQILRGLEYLHMHGVIHRDIKGTNILVTDDGLCKLADFGSAKSLLGVEFTASVTGTPNWMAPEVILETGHGRFADVWSLGCLVVEMATGKAPWSEFGDTLKVVEAVVGSQSLPKIPEEYSHNLRDFLNSCFCRRPTLRKNVAELLEHPFVKNCEFEKYSGDGCRNLSTRYVSD